jgi:hypothetical protein
MDKQDKKDLGTIGGVLTVIGGLIAVVINSSKDDKDKNMT